MQVNRYDYFSISDKPITDPMLEILNHKALLKLIDISVENPIS